MVLIGKRCLRRLAEKSEIFYRSPFGIPFVLTPMVRKLLVLKDCLYLVGARLAEVLWSFTSFTYFQKSCDSYTEKLLRCLVWVSLEDYSDIIEEKQKPFFLRAVVEGSLLVIEVIQLIRVPQPRSSTAVLQSRDIREVDEELDEVTRRRRRGTDCLRPVRERARFLVGARARLYGTTCSTARRQFAQSSRSGSARASLVGKQQIADGRKTCVTTVSEK